MGVQGCMLRVIGVAKDNLAAQLILQARWLGAGTSASRRSACALL